MEKAYGLARGEEEVDGDVLVDARVGNVIVDVHGEEVVELVLVSPLAVVAGAEEGEGACGRDGGGQVEARRGLPLYSPQGTRWVRPCGAKKGTSKPKDIPRPFRYHGV